MHLCNKISISSLIMPLIVYKSSVRSMYKVASRSVNMNLIRQGVGTINVQNQKGQNMSTLISYKFKKKAAQDLANDGTGKHPHICKETCVQPDCSTKKCTSLCDIGDKLDVKAHDTHKPPIGRMCKFISSHDAHGNPDAQYNVKAVPKKSITATQKQAYGSEIKIDPTHTAHVNSTPEMREKYEVD